MNAEPINFKLLSSSVELRITESQQQSLVPMLLFLQMTVDQARARGQSLFCTLLMKSTGGKSYIQPLLLDSAQQQQLRELTKIGYERVTENMFAYAEAHGIRIEKVMP